MTTRWRFLMRGADGERGIIAIVAALVLTIVVLGAALSVDIAGRVSELRRDQATADLAALDAARSLGTAQATAAASALRNGVDNTKTGVSVTATVSGSTVSVTVSTPYNDFLGGTHSRIVGTAVATNVGAAGFSIGSTLADINVGLGKMAVANLSLVGYNGLASGRVTLGVLATQLGFGALSPSAVLTSQVSVAQLVNASAAILGSGNPAYAALQTLGAGLALSTRGSSVTLALGTLLGLQAGSGLSASVNLLQAVTGAIELANGNAAIGASVNLSVPGVVSSSFSLAAIVPPTTVFGPVGISATNTQVTVNLSVTLSPVALIQVTLPLTLTLGGATGTLAAVDCTGSTATDIKLNSTFQDVSVGMSSPGTVTSLLPGNLGTVSGSATIPSNAVNGTKLEVPDNFTPDSVGSTPNDTVVTVNSNPASPTANFTGTGLTGGLTAGVLNLAVQTALPGLITAIASSLLTNVGVNIGNADYLGINLPPYPQCALPRLIK